MASKYTPEDYRRAIAAIESRGFKKPYEAVGPETRGDFPYGKYQVMGVNVPVWTEKYYGQRLTPQEFLRNPKAQDAVFDGRFGMYVDKYGPAGAAQAWIGGPGSVGKLNRKDVLGTSVGSYANQFMRNLGTSYGPQVGSAQPAPAQRDPAWVAQAAPPLPPPIPVAPPPDVQQQQPQSLDPIGSMIANLSSPAAATPAADPAAAAAVAGGGDPLTALISKIIGDGSQPSAPSPGGGVQFPAGAQPEAAPVPFAPLQPYRPAVNMSPFGMQPQNLLRRPTMRRPFSFS